MLGISDIPLKVLDAALKLSFFVLLAQCSALLAFEMMRCKNSQLTLT